MVIPEVKGLNLSWKQPIITNGVIRVYEVSYKRSNDDDDDYMSVNSTVTHHYITGLIPNSNYTIRIRAYTAAGYGNWTTVQESTLVELCEL